MCITLQTPNDYERKIPRDVEYYRLIALADWLKMKKIRKKDRDILERKTEEVVQMWLNMDLKEKIIFINRVLYEYWGQGNSNFGDFFAFRSFIYEKAEERRKRYHQQRFQYGAGSSKKTFNSANNEMNEAYSILGVARNADQQQIKKAYRALVKQHHPDYGGNEQMFIKVQGAYEALCRKVVINNVTSH